MHGPWVECVIPVQEVSPGSSVSLAWSPDPAEGMSDFEEGDYILPEVVKNTIGHVSSPPLPFHSSVHLHVACQGATLPSGFFIDTAPGCLIPNTAGIKSQEDALYKAPLVRLVKI